MKRSELTEFEIEEENFKLRLSRKNGDVPPHIVQAAPSAPAPAPPGPVPGPHDPNPPQGPEGSPAPAEEKGVKTIDSPMVGTFYRAPSPESAPFVDNGSKVGAETVVCIIEAMKVMNEIQAELSGTITEVLVDNGESVEYGQPLFKVKTA